MITKFDLLINLIFHCTQITWKIQAEGAQGLTESLCVHKNLKALESLRSHCNRVDALSKQQVEYNCMECSKMIEMPLGQWLFWLNSKWDIHLRKHKEVG